MMQTTRLRDRLQELIDGVPDDQLIAVIDAVLGVVVPEDDEPLSANELAALERSEQSDGRDRIPHAEVVAALDTIRRGRRT